MKAIKFTILVLVLGFVSRTAFAQTSSEEYNYLTKGYKIQIESGLDIKNGYSFTDLGTFRTNNRSCEFKSLVKLSTKKSVGTLCVFHAANGDKYYFCIPVEGSDDQLFQQYFISLSAIDNAEAAREYSLFLSLLWSQHK
jgi:hypothetical protein